MQDVATAKVYRVTDAQETYNTVSDNPLIRTFKRIIDGADFSGITDDLNNDLKDFGLTLENVAEGIGRIKLNPAEIRENIIGWTTRLPEDLVIGAGNISIQDAEIRNSN